jgi:hypothetical protein
LDRLRLRLHVPWLQRAVRVTALGSLFLAAVAACTPEIGDKCILSTDCSVRGDRLCDTSQPGGYCTQFNCRGNACPDKAACVLFNASIPGCGFDDRQGPGASRIARSFCVGRCFQDSDCRTEDGYVCADPREYPWRGMILDNDQNQRTCMVVPPEGRDAAAAQSKPAPVCSPVAPDTPPIDASAAKISDGAVVDTGVVDAGKDTGTDSGDAGADAPDGD